MPFPARSTFQGSEGAAVWFTWRNPSTGITQLWQTQWQTVLRKFQLKMKEILARGGRPFLTFTDQGVCYRGTSLDVFPASIIAEDVVQTDKLEANGQWSSEWAAALGLFLCATGQTDLAKELGLATTTRGEIASSLVRQVIWIAYWIAPSDVYDGNGAPITTPAAAANAGSGIAIPPDAVMPKWATTAAENPIDAGWTGQSTWGDPVPIPPSKQAELGGTKPWPSDVPVAPGTTTTTTTTTDPQAQSTVGKVILGVGGAALFAWLAFKKKKKRGR